MTKKLDYTIEDFINEKLHLHIGKMKHVQNGNLHSMMIELMEKPLLTLVLKETQGNQVQASAILGINRNTLSKKVKEYNIKIKKNLLSQAVTKKQKTKNQTEVSPF